MLRIQHYGGVPPVAEEDGRPPGTRVYWVSRIINLNSITAREVIHNGRVSVIKAAAVHAVGCSVTG